MPKIKEQLPEERKLIFSPKTLKTFKSQKYLFLMPAPFIIWIIIFKYIPLWGWTMAFQKYMPGRPFFQQEWVGLKYFILMFEDDLFYIVLRNTLAMSLLSLIFGFTLPIVLAVLLNEITINAFKRTIQTISYLPHFVSWVIVASLFSEMLSIDGGVVNNILLGLNIIDQPVQFMAKPEYFWGIVTLADVWKEIGWNSIIFLAAIAGISPDLYESAMVDGASRFRRIWYITIPGILPTVMVILIMSLGNIINIGFEKQFLMRNSLVSDYSDVLDLYILDYGISAGRWAFGTAAGMFKSVISIIMVFAANTLSRKTLGVSIITK
ncbi:MAG TPA: sugar ABC transporter permease [Clostridiaceae bacterium]|nr:sugar ABC transporter permease [Clostridiaceae bacterium]